MVELLQTVSLDQIVLIVITLACSLKGLISFYDWGKERLGKIFLKDQNAKEEIENIKEAIQELKKSQMETYQDLKDIKNSLQILLESDRDDIKAYITEKHHYFCYEKKWINDFNLDCIERRYSHYIQEGGNSFIEGFMKELRSLPKEDPFKTSSGLS